MLFYIYCSYILFGVGMFILNPPTINNDEEKSEIELTSISHLKKHYD